MSETNSLAPTPPPVTIAFYTTGDPRISHGLPANAPAAAKLSNSDRFKKRAESLATPGQVYAANDTASAISQIGSLPANLRITKVLFIGHGFPNGYFFSGTPKDAEGFTATQSQVLLDLSTDANSASLINALIGHFKATDHIEIGFLACYSGTNNLIPSVSQAMNNKKFGDYIVGGFKNDYQTRYSFATPSGAIDQTKDWHDIILDSSNTKSVIGRSSNNNPPEYEVSRGASPDPLSTLLP